MSDMDSTTIERVETLISNDGKVAVVVPMMPVQATGYRLLDASTLAFQLVANGSPAQPHVFAMAETAQGAWQILVDTESLLVVELGQELMSILDDRELEEGVLQELARLQQIADDFAKQGVDVYEPDVMRQLVAAGAVSPEDAKALVLIQRNVRDYELAPMG